MADIFISYARSDQPAAQRIAEFLEAAGHAVWWDRHIKGGAAYAVDIEKELREAKLVLVLWSKEACSSDWVKDEAVFARDRHRLLPATLDGVDSPLGFRQYQAIDLKGWKGDPTAPGARALLDAVAAGLEAPAPPPPKRLSLLKRIRTHPNISGALIAAVALVVVAAALGLRQQPLGLAGFGAAAKTQDLSVAVLPFVDMSPDGDQAYFADGLSEELLNVLVRVDGLKVASRTSAFALKDEALSIGEIGRKLGVDYVVEGSVRKSDSEVRITAQLIDTSNDRHLWSQTYDRHLSDIFRVQDEIATAVVEALRSEIGLDRAAEIEIKAATSDMTAYDMYLKARELFIKRGGDNVRESLRLSEEMVKLDPAFARGWEQLAAVYSVASSWGIEDRDYAALAMETAAKALELDPSLSMPYAVMGLAYRTHYPTPWTVSIDNLKRAIERDDKNASAWLWLGMDYLALGYFDEALAALSKCLEVDDAYSNCRKNRSIVYLFKNEIDLAMKDAEKNAEIGYLGDFDIYIPTMLKRGDRFSAFTISRFINWRDGFPHLEYVNALEHPEAIDPKAWEKVKAWAEAKNVEVAKQTHVVFAFQAYDDVTVDTFDNAYDNLWLPAYAHFRKSPKFKELVRGLGMPEYWKEVGFPPQCRPLEGDDFECS